MIDLIVTAVLEGHDLVDDVLGFGVRIDRQSPQRQVQRGLGIIVIPFGHPAVTVGIPLSIETAITGVERISEDRLSDYEA